MPQRLTGLKAVSNYKRGVKGKAENENLNAQTDLKKLFPSLTSSKSKLREQLLAPISKA